MDKEQGATGTYLDLLNEQQRAAVEYLEGPELVIAGAGSGKTRVLTYKVVHLLNRGYEPWRIMALTFTNKAANEMRERIKAQCDDASARRIWMGTFHSIFARFLRRDAEALGYSHNFTIYDADDSKSLIKTVIKDMGLDEKIYKPTAVQSAISWAKNALVSAEKYRASREIRLADERSRRPLMWQIYATYCARCKLADAMDFDDLLYNTAYLFHIRPDILNHYREFFRYILVDEYQDTNFAQNFIILQLAKGIGNICVVGDDAQSIYSFRGANIRNILDLHKSFPNLATFKLERNYRSSKNIINAANALIAHNNAQIHKDIYSLNEAGEPIEVHSGYSDYEEAALVATRIITRRAVTSDSWNDFAVLYRTNAQSRVIEESLRRRNIPYRIYGGLAFYQRKEVKDTLAWLRLSLNPNDDEAVRRIINVPPRGIGKTTIDKITAAAIEANVSMWKVLDHLDQYSVNINTNTARKLSDFTEMIRRFNDMNTEQSNAEQVAKEIIRSTGILAMYYCDNAPENVTKRENIEELARSVHSFVEDRLEQGINDVSLFDFIADVSLLTDNEQTDEQQQKDCVKLMTLHAAKGLEFANVFIVGVEDNLLPSMMGDQSVQNVEEERRLLYVGLTRAKNFCMLSHVHSRFLNGQTIVSRPSRFLHEIPEQYLRYMHGGSPCAKVGLHYGAALHKADRGAAAAHRAANIDFNGSSPTQSAAAPRPQGFTRHSVDELAVGMNIVHSKFGAGKIIGITNIGSDDVIVVCFAEEVKRLMLKFAAFKILQ